jgi:hypothetical protein
MHDYENKSVEQRSIMITFATVMMLAVLIIAAIQVVEYIELEKVVTTVQNVIGDNNGDTTSLFSH